MVSLNSKHSLEFYTLHKIEMYMSIIDCIIVFKFTKGCLPIRLY